MSLFGSTLFNNDDKGTPKLKNAGYSVEIVLDGSGLNINKIGSDGTRTLVDRRQLGTPFITNARSVNFVSKKVPVK